MPRFLCWSDGDGPEDGTEHDASCAREAAEKHSEWRDRGGVEYPPEREVHVKGPDGVEVFDVILHSVPEYEARKRRPAK